MSPEDLATAVPSPIPFVIRKDLARFMGLVLRGSYVAQADLLEARLAALAREGVLEDPPPRAADHRTFARYVRETSARLKKDTGVKVVGRYENVGRTIR